MTPTQSTVRTYNSRLVRLAALSWLATILYFPVQLIVAAAWNPAYSWSNNYISSLGNTACGLYENSYVCSPLHNLMNVDFVVTGLLIAIGAILFGRTLAARPSSKAAFGLLTLSGLGTIVVGLVPENTNLDLHSLAALMPFLFGNIAILLLGLRAKELPRWLRTYSVITGAVGVTAFVLFSSNAYLGLGVGGMERVVDYVQAIWFIVFGAAMLRHRSA